MEESKYVGGPFGGPAFSRVLDAHQKRLAQEDPVGYALEREYGQRFGVTPVRLRLNNKVRAAKVMAAALKVGRPSHYIMTLEAKAEARRLGIMIE